MADDAKSEKPVDLGYLIEYLNQDQEDTQRELEQIHS